MHDHENDSPSDSGSQKSNQAGARVERRKISMDVLLNVVHVDAQSSFESWVDVVGQKQQEHVPQLHPLDHFLERNHFI